MKTPIEIAPHDFQFYADELQLISVEETEQGQMVTLQIAPDIKACPFSRAKQRNGGPGTRFYAVFIEIDDDDEPINQRKRRVVEQDAKPVPIKSATTDSAIRCNNPAFQRFAAEQLSAMDVLSKKEMVAKLKMPHDLVSRGLTEGMKNSKTAAEWAKFYIYWVCKIHSRRELSSKKAARDRYYQGIVIPFDRWAN